MQITKKMKEYEKNNSKDFQTLPTNCTVQAENQGVQSVPGLIDHCEVNIPADKIILINLRNNDYHIVTQYMDVISKLPLPILENMLGDQFLRISAYLMINLNYVRLLVEDKVTMDNGKVITLPNKNKKDLSMRIINELTKKIKHN